MKKVAVIQSNYIPWKGYFDIIHDVDIFIFYDDVQYTKNDWRNRNVIKTPNGTTWLSIPAGANENRLICDVQITDTKWQQKHWKSLIQYYGNAPFFKTYEQFFEDFYCQHKWANLSELNQMLIKHISKKFLGIETEFHDSREYAPQGQKLERLVDLLIKAGATHYVSGPSAKNYIDERLFYEAGISLTWKNYEGYPEYSHFFPPFQHGVTILDLLFHTGPKAPWYIWGWRQGAMERE